jgi:hypothetical protein
MFDQEGHVVVTPRQWQQGLSDPGRLTRDWWLVGTPCAFATYAGYREFLLFLADGFSVHPNNIAIRGSTKIGFSVSSKAHKLWVVMRPDSDLDLAIVDADYYHFFDREIRSYERRMGSRLYGGRQLAKTERRRENRKFYTYRYQDMPDIGCVRDHFAILSSAPVKECCGSVRPLTAFVYRDWWCLQARCEYDLRELRKALNEQQLPAGGDAPRAAQLLAAVASDKAVGHETPVLERRCPRCNTVEQTLNGKDFFCPQCNPQGTAPVT